MRFGRHLASACTGLVALGACDARGSTAPAGATGSGSAEATASVVVTARAGDVTLRLARGGAGCQGEAGTSRLEITAAPLAAVERGADVVAWTSRVTAHGHELRRDQARAAFAVRGDAGALDVLAPDGVAWARLSPGPAGARFVDGAGAVVATVAPSGAPLGDVAGTSDAVLAALLVAPAVPPAIRLILGCERLLAAGKKS